MFDLQQPEHQGQMSNVSQKMPILSAAATYGTFASHVRSSACLLIEPVADVLGQAWPPLAGSVVALLGIPAVLGMDAFDKHLRSRR